VFGGERKWDFVAITFIHVSLRGMVTCSPSLRDYGRREERGRKMRGGGAPLRQAQDRLSRVALPMMVGGISGDGKEMRKVLTNITFML